MICLLFRKHAISEDKIEELASVANLSKRINILYLSCLIIFRKAQDPNQTKLAVKNNVDEIGMFFPKLVWVLRDFSLDIQDMTPKYKL